MADINPVSSSWASVDAGGDVGALVNAFFAQKGNEAAQKVKAAIAKAQRDSSINKGMDAAKNEVVQNGGEASVAPGGSLHKLLSSAGQKGNRQARELAAAVASGKLDSGQLAGVNSFLNDQKTAMGNAGGGGGVNDDSVNMTLVQIAFQEFNNAINGGSAAAKSTGDSKKSITDRMQ